jgi:hypothetical protein
MRFIIQIQELEPWNEAVDSNMLNNISLER